MAGVNSSHCQRVTGLAWLLVIGITLLFVASSVIVPGGAGGRSLPSPVRADEVRADPAAGGSPPARSSSSFPSPIQHVVTVLLENQNYSTVLAEGPYEAYLAHTYALATNDYSVRHYSVPAYLAATSGIDSAGFGVYNARNIGDLADSSNLTWAAFEQSMPQPCDPESNWTAGYDSDHNPFIMFEDIEESATRCDAHDLTWSSWTNDVSVNSIPNYSFITPNTTNDDHNSSIPAGDGLAQELVESPHQRFDDLFQHCLRDQLRRVGK